MQRTSIFESIMYDRVILGRASVFGCIDFRLEDPLGQVEVTQNFRVKKKSISSQMIPIFSKIFMNDLGKKT